MGKARIARSLARAELHLGVTTVGRLLKAKKPGRPQRHISDDVEKAKKPRVVNAKYPNHLWHADLTAVPTGVDCVRLGFRSRCRNSGRSAGGWPWWSITSPVAWCGSVLAYFSICLERAMAHLFICLFKDRWTITRVKISGSGKTPNTTLPKGWSQTVRSAVLQAISLWCRTGPASRPACRDRSHSRSRWRCSSPSLRTGS